MSEIRNIKAKAIGIAGGFTLLQDLLQPIAPFAGYVAAISAISLLLIALAKLFIQFGENLKTAMLLSASTLVLSTGLWGFQQYYDASDTGVLAENIPQISNFQKSIGIAQEAIEILGKTEKNTADTVKVLTGEKGSPQVVLKTKGISWDEDNFKKAVIRGDLEVVNLFLTGGLSVNLYAGTNQNFFLKLIHDSTNKHFNAMISLLVRNEIIVPNKPLNIYTMGSFKNPTGDIPYPQVGARFYKYFVTDKINAQTKNSQKVLELATKEYEAELEEYPGKRIKYFNSKRYNNDGTYYYTLPKPKMPKLNYTPSTMASLGSYLTTVNLLTVAVWESNKRKVKALLKSGEDPRFQGRIDATDNKSPVITPISEAKLFSNKEILNLLKK